MSQKVSCFVARCSLFRCDAWWCWQPGSDEKDPPEAVAKRVNVLVEAGTLPLLSRLAHLAEQLERLQQEDKAAEEGLRKKSATRAQRESAKEAESGGGAGASAGGQGTSSSSRSGAATGGSSFAAALSDSHSHGLQEATARTYEVVSRQVGAVSIPSASLVASKIFTAVPFDYCVVQLDGTARENDSEWRNGRATIAVQCWIRHGQIQRCTSLGSPSHHYQSHPIFHVSASGEHSTLSSTVLCKGNYPMPSHGVATIDPPLTTAELQRASAVRGCHGSHESLFFPR